MIGIVSRAPDISRQGISGDCNPEILRIRRRIHIPVPSGLEPYKYGVRH